MDSSVDSIFLARLRRLRMWCGVLVVLGLIGAVATFVSPPRSWTNVALPLVLAGVGAFNGLKYHRMIAALVTPT